MNRTFETKSSSVNIFRFALVFVSLVILPSGCQQMNNLVNSNTTANANQANTNTANSNINTAQPFKKNLLGTWIAVDSPKNRVVFTADEVTFYQDGTEVDKSTYTRLSDQSFEAVLNGKKREIKFTFEGDDALTLTGDTAAKFKRELATDTSDNKAGKIAEIEKQLIGSWVQQNKESKMARDEDGKPVMENGSVKMIDSWHGNIRFIFSKNLVQILAFSHRDGMFIGWTGPYRLKDEKTIEVLRVSRDSFWRPEYKIYLGEDGKLVFDLEEDIRIVRESDNTEFVYSEEKFVMGYFPKAMGVWVSDNDKLLIDNRIVCRISSDGTAKEDSFSQDYSSEGTTLRNSRDKIASDSNTLTITDKNGVEKKYTRLTNWAGENYLSICMQGN